MFSSITVGGRSRPKVLVVGQFKGAKLDKQTLARDADGSIAAAAARGEASGEVGAIAEAYPESGFSRVLIVGLGDKGPFGPDVLRSVAGAVGRRVAAVKESGIEVDLVGPVKAGKLDAFDAGCAFGEGLGIVGWNYDRYRGAVQGGKKRSALAVKADDKAFADGLSRGLGLAAGTNLARDLSQTPPNIATPAYMASEAQKMARKAGLKCRVIKGADIDKHNLVGLRTVGQASENKPCLIRLEYTPASGRKAAKPLVLLGKTMTYDSGGLSLKINNGMKGMKRDKDGGCAVMGAMLAIATVIKPKIPVVGLLVAAENSVSDEAYRPDDVMQYPNGVNVEVTNTDAEGRLVLADGLCWACAKENPAAIVDFATLTGGAVIALGSVYSCMWCEDDRLRGTVECASAGCGERVWRMPMHREYRDMMKSPIADIVNSAPVREAHPVQGAAFLTYFVDEGVPFAHIDIAGVHATEKDKGPYIPGPTGFGARLGALIAEAM